MTIPLPEAIQRYFAMSNGSISIEVSECFAADAVVFDEGGTYRTHADIAAWMKATRQKYEFNATPINTLKEDSHQIVKAEVSGNFPGSPAILRYSFLLSDSKIQSLEIS